MQPPLRALRRGGRRGLAAKRVPARYDGSGGAGAMGDAVKAMCEAAEAAVRDGSQCVILTDRPEHGDASQPAIPSLLAVGAVHHHLIRAGLRLDASIVAERGPDGAYMDLSTSAMTDDDDDSRVGSSTSTEEDEEARTAWKVADAFMLQQRAFESDATPTVKMHVCVWQGG